MGQYDPKKPSAFNVVNILIVLVLGTGIYVGAWYLPHWYPVWKLTGIMHGVGNDAYRETNDEKLMERLLKESVRTGLRLSKENFTIERVPYTPEEIEEALAGKANSDHARKTFDKRGRRIFIYFENTVDAKWPFMEKYTPLTFTRTVETDLAIIKW